MATSIPQSIHTITKAGFSWINVTRTGKSELDYLRHAYAIDPLDLADCKPELQRPKIVSRPKYLFAIFVSPILNKNADTVHQQEVDFFIAKRTVITVHNGAIGTIEEFFSAINANPDGAAALMKNPALFIAQLLDEIIDTSFPLLQHLSTEIDKVRTRMLAATSNRAHVLSILRMKDNIVTFRKAAQPSYGLLCRLMAALPRYLHIGNDARQSFERLVDHTKEIGDHLEIYRDAVEAIEDTYATLISFRTNDILKTLTVFSVILLILTFIANLFIMEGFARPFIYQSRFDWWGIVAGMALIALISAGIFKKKHWL